MTSQLLINEPPLQVLPTLAKTVGLNEAIVLQQVHYWLNPHFNTNYFQGRHWVHNTFAQWQQQFSFWSNKTIKRTIAALEDSGLLISFVTRTFKKTKYYTLDYDLLGRIHPLGLNDLPLPKPALEGTEREEDAENPETEEASPWGHPDPLDGDALASPETLETEQYPPFGATQSVCPKGHTDPSERDNLTSSEGSICPSQRGQLVPFDGVKVTPFHYAETTPETTAKIIPLLPPPSSARGDFGEAQEEEEEEKNKNIKPNNTQQPIYEVMISIWNETVQARIHPGQIVQLTDQRRKLLEHFLNTVLRDRKRIRLDLGLQAEDGYTELDAWRDYCNRIAQSRFLAGQNSSGFKITLDWALLPEKAYKILEGAIYDKPVPQGQAQTQIQQYTQPDQQPWEAFAQSLANTVPSGPWHSPWLRISQYLAKKLGQIRYKTWFSKVYLGGIADTTATLHVASRFTRDYIEANFRFDLLDAIQTLYPAVKYLDFQVVSTEGGAQ